MSPRFLKHIKLITLFSVFLILHNSCDNSENSHETVKKSRKTDTVFCNLPFASAELPSTSYYIVTETAIHRVKKDTIDGIATREPLTALITLYEKNSRIKEEKEDTNNMRSNFVLPLKKLHQSYTSPNKYLTINFENDVLLAMDYYFTNGVSFEYFHPLFETSLYNRFMIPYRKESLNYYGLILVQNMYTPTRLDTTAVLFGDRPFASYLYLGFNKVIFDSEETLKICSELDIGLLGPTSLGGLIQSTFHRTEPTGWDNQINNDIIINYNLDILKGIIQTEAFSLNATGGIKAGTLYDNAYGGLSIVAGKFAPYYEGFSLNSKSGKIIQYGLTLSGRMTFVAYDATMQGGFFSHNDYHIKADMIKRLTHSAKIGVFFSYKWFGLEANVIHLSHEFKGGRPHKWVHLSTSFSL